MRLRRRKGLSVPELLLACFFIGLLTAMVFSSYHMGLRAVFKSQAHNELLTQIQIAARRIGEPMEQSSGFSVSIDQTSNAEAVSFLTNVDEDGASVFFPDGSPGPPGLPVPSGSPVWQAYLIFYFDASSNTLRTRRVDLTPTATQRFQPTPIEQYDPGTGTAPLSTYCNSGQQIARMIDSFKVEIDPGLPDAYQFFIRASKPKEGNRHETSSALTWTIAVRN